MRAVPVPSEASAAMQMNRIDITTVRGRKCRPLRVRTVFGSPKNTEGYQFLARDRGSFSNQTNVPTVTGVVLRVRGAAWRWPARDHPSGPFGAVGVARAKAAQAGFPHRGQPRPRKPRRGFGRRAPKVQRGPRRRPTYSLKGSVPEVPAHVSVWLCTDLGGGGGAQPRVRPEGVARSRGLVVPLCTC